MIFFNNCDVRVDGTGVMASQASLNSQSPTIAMRSIGRNRPHISAGGRYQNALKFNYYINIDNDPCYARVTDLKETTNFSGLSPQVIEIAGISGSYYLQQYELNLAQNEIAEASVTYVGYELTTGALRDKKDQYDYIQSGFSGFAHAWTAKITSNDGDVDVPVYNMNYAYKAQINPIFVLGKKFPTQVQFVSADEDITIIRDKYKPLTWYGESGFVMFGTQGEGEEWHAADHNPRVELLKLATLCDDSITDSMVIDVSNSIFESEQLSLDTNDFATINMASTKYY